MEKPLTTAEMAEAPYEVASTVIATFAALPCSGETKVWNDVVRCVRWMYGERLRPCAVNLSSGGYDLRVTDAGVVSLA